MSGGNWRAPTVPAVDVEGGITMVNGFCSATGRVIWRVLAATPSSTYVLTGSEGNLGITMVVEENEVGTGEVDREAGESTCGSCAREADSVHEATARLPATSLSRRRRLREVGIPTRPSGHNPEAFQCSGQPRRTHTARLARSETNRGSTTPRLQSLRSSCVEHINATAQTTIRITKDQDRTSKR